MTIRNYLICALLSLSVGSIANAQTSSGKQLKPGYVESCIQNQVRQHEKLKSISSEDFRPYCECTAKQLGANLSPSQLEELNQSKKNPSWFKSAEDSASKACLKLNNTTQV